MTPGMLLCCYLVGLNNYLVETKFRSRLPCCFVPLNRMKMNQKDHMCEKKPAHVAAGAFFVLTENQQQFESASC